MTLIHRDPIQGVIFDLDDTLFDCTGLLTLPARERASATLGRHPSTPEPDELTRIQTELADRTSSSAAIREIGTRYRIASDLVEEALFAYNRDDVTPIDPFPDAIPTLTSLRDQNLFLALVTTGRRTRQLAKVEILGLDAFFSVDKNLFVHETSPESPSKEPQFRLALQAGSLKPESIISVGDKLDSDIRVGNRVGMITVRLRHGRQKNSEPSSPSDKPDHDITQVSEVLNLIS